jgi:organic hydroperoxide reductase OsmC/OhrA
VKISAVVRNASATHEVVVSTAGVQQRIAVPTKATGKGSAINGGEFLVLALATCYCNDLYREAARLGFAVESVEVEATAEFPGVGLAATNIKYKAKVLSSASAAEITELLRQTDAVAEVHNTVRSGAAVTLENL